ncbi:MAG: glycosyltransferase [Halothiobacillaceae bacterium]|nr:glycosyltransferase [Halothiobacillaceae bacterium]
MSMTAQCRVSVIVTTYNRPDALDKVLAALAAQRLVAFEILVADDGSGEATRECVQRWQGRIGVRHVWHADEGFRAAAIRNRAAAQAQGEYLIFLDGDSIPWPDFVARHVALAEAGRFVSGNRLLLSQAMTRQVLDEADTPAQWPWWRWLGARWRGQVNRLLPMLRLPDGRWRERVQHEWRGARTCNLALWRADFVQVNGFDEAYAGWGHEDADLAMRLIRQGVLRKDGRYALPVLHLWHAESPREHEAANRERLQAVIDGQRPLRATLGMDQYL